MATHRARQQKKQAKKKSERNQKRKQLALQQSPGLPQLVPLARKGEIVTTAVSEAIFRDGLGYAWISRKLEDGRVIVADFLVDVWCLGVKNVVFKACPVGEAAFMYRRSAENLAWRSIAPVDLRNLVRGAVDYAHTLGLESHSDYRYAQAMLEGIEGEPRESFVFGKDGKPLFINGPNDSRWKCQKVIEKVLAAGGDYMIGGPDLDVLKGIVPLESASQVVELMDWDEDDDEDDEVDNDRIIDVEDFQRLPRLTA